MTSSIPTSLLPSTPGSGITGTVGMETTVSMTSSPFALTSTTSSTASTSYTPATSTTDPPKTSTTLPIRLTTSPASFTISSTASTTSPSSITTSPSTGTISAPVTAAAPFTYASTHLIQTTGIPGNVTRSSGTPTPLHSVSSGAAAGIGIGAAFLGAFIALLAAFLFFRYSKRQNRWQSAYSNDRATARYNRGEAIDFENNKNNIFTVANSALAHGATPLDRTEDSQIRKSMKDLNELVHQHVENHYNIRTFQGRHSDLEREILKCGYSDHSIPTAQTLVNFLVNPGTRRMAMRQLIAKVILRSIELGSEDTMSLLPIYVLAACQALLGANASPGENQAEFSRHFVQWRRLTADLISLSPTQETDPSLQSAILANSTLVNNALSSFINPEAEGARRQRENLESIIHETAAFGMVLFAQPGNWVFRWEVKPGMRRTGSVSGRRGQSFVVFPGIEEQKGMKGAPRVLIEPDIKEL